MAASRLLHAEAACVILLSFAAGSRKSYWSGCMKAATVICRRRDPVLELQFPTPLRVVLLCFATQSLQIAL